MARRNPQAPAGALKGRLREIVFWGNLSVGVRTRT